MTNENEENLASNGEKGLKTFYASYEEYVEAVSRNEYCVGPTVQARVDDGTPINNITYAKQTIELFDSTHGNPTIKAYHIGLNKLRDMLMAADLHNVRNPNEQIIGYRFYNSITDRTDPQLPSSPDLVVSPVLQDNNDYFDLGYNNNQQHTPNQNLLTLYNNLRPCPRICG